MREQERFMALEGIAGWDLHRLQTTKCLVVGAGALGNEVLKNLALLGVGEVTILDFDRIEASNLSRSVLFRAGDIGEFKAKIAAERTLELYPQLSVHWLVGDVMCDLGLGLVREMDLIFGCVDNRLARLWLNRWAFRAGKGWIGGGILGQSGQVTGYAPGRTCYECGITAKGWQEINHRMGCTDLALRYMAEGQAPTTPLAASVIGAWMVQEGLRVRMEGNEGALFGQMWNYEGPQRSTQVYELKSPGEDCPSHWEYREMEELPVSADMTVGEVMTILENKFGEGVEIILDQVVGTAIAGLQSGNEVDLVIARPHIDAGIARLAQKIEGEAVGIPRDHLHTRIDRNFSRPDATLADLGIPHWHILRLRSGEQRFLGVLSFDAEKFRESQGHFGRKIGV